MCGWTSLGTRLAIQLFSGVGAHTAPLNIPSLSPSAREHSFNVECALNRIISGFSVTNLFLTRFYLAAVEKNWQKHLPSGGFSP